MCMYKPSLWLIDAFKLPCLYIYVAIYIDPPPPRHTHTPSTLFQCICHFRRWNWPFDWHLTLGWDLLSLLLEKHGKMAQLPCIGPVAQTWTLIKLFDRVIYSVKGLLLGKGSIMGHYEFWVEWTSSQFWQQHCFFLFCVFCFCFFNFFYFLPKAFMTAH